MSRSSKGGFDDPNLPAESCDLVFLSSVYKEIDSRVAFMKSPTHSRIQAQTGDSGVSDERAVAGTTAKVSSGGTAGDRRTQKLPASTSSNSLISCPENTFWCLKADAQAPPRVGGAASNSRKLCYPHRLPATARAGCGRTRRGRWLVGVNCAPWSSYTVRRADSDHCCSWSNTPWRKAHPRGDWSVSRPHRFHVR